VSGHDAGALNVEGMEFASNGTAYLAFRAPLEPATNRHLAMLVPVTNFAALPTGGNPGSVHATFGAPIFFDLGGLGIRDIRENTDGQYLIIAGSADDANSGFVLYIWDGNPAHAPRKTGTTLPQLPSADNLGAWETIVSVPAPLIAGAPLRLLQDDGDAIFYNDGLTSKTGTVTDLQKDLGVTFTYTPPAPQTTVTAAAVVALLPRAGQSVAVLAAVAPTHLSRTLPSGQVTVTVTNSGGNVVYTSHATLAPILPLAVFGIPGTVLASGHYTVTVAYQGDGSYSPSSTSVALQIKAH
jgi:hypothetical protein